MSDFKRDDRYIVIKKSAYPSLEIAQLESYLAENYIWQTEAVVVESDWPEYEKVWEMIEDRVHQSKPICMHNKTHYSQRWGEHVCSYCGQSMQT